MGRRVVVTGRGGFLFTELGALSRRNFRSYPTLEKTLLGEPAGARLLGDIVMHRVRTVPQQATVFAGAFSFGGMLDEHY